MSSTAADFHLRRRSEVYNDLEDPESRRGEPGRAAPLNLRATTLTLLYYSDVTRLRTRRAVVLAGEREVVSSYFTHDMNCVVLFQLPPCFVRFRLVYTPSH
ncbi:hypothetical protein E2C01_027117 [Portunus trituberculatus]|uniref:Uncharacterized protein n=1 Tax=Portunus trituberculatus TaxID=210409 RepID=A0A5B7EKP2_PORTR|nr:hypothetical protein [Portunus trituberculatus]